MVVIGMCKVVLRTFLMNNLYKDIQFAFNLTQLKQIYQTVRKIENLDIMKAGGLTHNHIIVVQAIQIIIKYIDMM